jgi:shikimate kinase
MRGELVSHRTVHGDSKDGDAETLRRCRRKWRMVTGNELRRAGKARPHIIVEMTPQLPLRIALIGMSGAGKTFWTRRIAETGVPAISCDDRIEEKLAPRLQAGGYAGINGVAAWMGWPDSATYRAREAEYLAEEIAALDEILGGLEREREKSLVLDTTGSVIYCGTHLLHRMRKLMTMVYLAASDAEQDLLVERYLSDPKPVLWRGAFHANAGETSRDTVARCYPRLIAVRRQSYAAIAHVTLPVATLRELPRTAEAFLELLPQAGGSR